MDRAINGEKGVKVCIFYWEEAEKRLSGDHERVIGLASALRDLGCDVFLVESASDNKNIIYKGIHIIHFSKLISRKFRFNAWTRSVNKITNIKDFITKVLYLLIDEPFITLKVRKIIASCELVLTMGDLTLAPIVFAKLHKKRIVLDYMSLYFLAIQRMRDSTPFYSYYSRLTIFTALTRLQCLISDKIILPSSEELGLTIKFGVPKKKLGVIPNCINTQTFKPSSEARTKARKTLGISPTDFLILFLGGSGGAGNTSAIEYIKKTLVPEILSNYNNVVFVVTGSWKPIGERLRVVFAKNSTELVGYINAADLCIAPLSIGAGTKIKILAYMACEKIVVATPVATEGLDISSASIGVLIHHLNEFAKGVEYAIDHIEDLKHMGTKNREYIEKYYSLKKMVNSTKAEILGIFQT